MSRAEDIEGGKLFISKIEEFDSKAVKAGVELLAKKLGESIIVLVSGNMVIASVTEGFVKKAIMRAKLSER